MFYSGTEVIVIGSNVKRRGGPRVGSTGFISNVEDNIIQVGKENFIKGLISFSKYGYEKDVRLEAKQILLYLADLPQSLERDQDVNYRKLVNKAVNKTKHVVIDSKLPCLFVAPTENIISLQDSTKEDLAVNYILNLMKSNVVFSELRGLFFNYTDEYSRLRRILSNKAYSTARILISSKKDKAAFMLSQLLEKDMHCLSEIVFLINTILALNIKNSPTNFNKDVPSFLYKTVLKDKLFINMFVEHKYIEVRELCRNNKIKADYVEKLKIEIVKKGQLAYKTHQR